MVLCGGKFEKEDATNLLRSTEFIGDEKHNTAFQSVRENIEDLNGRVEARDTDIIFLKGLMESPVMSSLVKVQDQIEANCESIHPVSVGNLKLLKDVQKNFSNNSSKESQDLTKVLDDPHLEALIEAHDIVSSKKHDSSPAPITISSVPVAHNHRQNAESIKMVGIRKTDEDAPLGITVRNEENLVIARILAGGIIDQQGLLSVGDAILEVNGVEVHTPIELQQQLQKSKVGNVTFKIRPSNTDVISSAEMYVKALYTYDPTKDSLLPCKGIGLSFKQGDILQVLNQDDPNWWQARRLNSMGPAGLIPSQELEERRHAFVRPEYDHATKSTMCGTKMTKKKRKTMYQSRENGAEFDKAELLLYEEVARMPPFQRKTLVLLGAEGVGRRTTKNRLIQEFPSKFGAPMPHTSRPIREGEQDGKNYHFITREALEADIAENKYLEFGEHNGHLYGTKLESVRDIIRSGKMCILDCNPKALKILKSSEFMPYIVFIAAPPIDQLKQMHDFGKHNYSNRNLTFDRAMGRQGSRRAKTMESLASMYEEEDLKNIVEASAWLQRAFEKFFDLVLINSNFEKTYEELKEAIETLSSEPQWVPISWVY